MDALALLKEDHDKAKKLMEELAATTERGVKTREEKWTKLLKELTIHENIEEEIFYPALHDHQKL
jgi:hemerythrin superfamily protein